MLLRPKTTHETTAMVKQIIQRGLALPLIHLYLNHFLVIKPKPVGLTPKKVLQNSFDRDTYQIHYNVTLFPIFSGLMIIVIGYQQPTERTVTTTSRNIKNILECNLRSP